MNILFVCTGNICRSPLAAAIARRELLRLQLDSVVVGSAGTAAVDGSPASGGAAVVAEENGLSLGDHRARRLTRELASGADLVVAMEPEHAERARELGAQRAIVLADGVPDPYGLDAVAYRNTWTQIASALPAFLAEHLAHSDQTQPLPAIPGDT